jgi:prolyl-tRNA editing enzyme YbaK/EbsC (Cys-tRNA(Pro) deacylase)
VPCDPALADTADFAKQYGFEMADSANAILVQGKGKGNPVALCMVLATHRLDVNTACKKKLGTSKASFASADVTKELTGMEIGGVTPAGLLKPLPIWVDAAVMTREKVIIGGGSRARKVFIAPLELLALPNVEVVEDLAKLIE